MLHRMTADWILEGLRKPGKTQKGLADALGLDPSQVSRMIAGKRRIKADELDRISGYLESPPPRRIPVYRVPINQNETRLTEIESAARKLAPLISPALSPEELAWRLQRFLEQVARDKKGTGE